MEDQEPKAKISKEEKYLTMLKIGLQLLVATSMLGSIYWIIYFSINYKRYVAFKNHKTDVPPKRTKTELLTSLCIAVMGLIFCMMGMVGIKKENRTLVALILLMALVAIGVDAVLEQWWTLFHRLLLAVMLSVFLFTLHKKKSHAKFTVSEYD